MGRLEFKTIGEISEVISGSTPKTSVLENWDGHINWITPTDLKDGHNWYISEAERKITDIGFKDAGLKMLPRGTVLLTSRAPIGKVAINATEMCTNQGFKSIICNSDVLHNEYLYFFLLGKKDYLNSLGRGATFKEISKTIVEGIQIPLPPLESQKKIAAVLDKAQDLIDKRKEQLAKLDEFVQSVFLDLVGPGSDYYHSWPIAEISELVLCKKDSMRTGPFGSDLLHSEFVENGIRVLGIDNAVENRFQWKEQRFITHEKYELLKRYTVFPEDVIITIMGTTGRCAVVPMDITTAISTKHLAVLTLNKAKTNPYFISFCIHSHPFVLRQITLKNTGAIMDGLNLGKIKTLKIPVPPLDLQNQFAAIVEKTEQQKALMQQSLTEMENNFNSLMQQAFKGELFS